MKFQTLKFLWSSEWLDMQFYILLESPNHWNSLVHDSAISLLVSMLQMVGESEVEVFKNCFVKYQHSFSICTHLSKDLLSLVLDTSLKMSHQIYFEIILQLCFSASRQYFCYANNLKGFDLRHC